MIFSVKGMQAHETIEAVIVGLNASILDGIEEEDAKVFLKVIRKIRENVEKQDF